MQKFLIIVLATSLLMLSGCETSQQTTIAVNTGIHTEEEPEQGNTTQDIGSGLIEQAVNNQRLIADLLYEALQALAANRLTTPLDNNAHSRFSRVLAYQADNEIALQGIQDIVVKYLDLAHSAGQRGQFDSAELMIERAKVVDEKHPGIAPAMQALQKERQSTDKFYNLDAQQLASHSESIQEKLKEIGIYARDNESFVLITAPTDGQARWVYLQMQKASEGYRLRANIEIGELPTVRLIKRNVGSEKS